MERSGAGVETACARYPIPHPCSEVRFLRTDAPSSSRLAQPADGPEFEAGSSQFLRQLPCSIVSGVTAGFCPQDRERLNGYRLAGTGSVSFRSQP